jgi:hypothetical protein
MLLSPQAPPWRVAGLLYLFTFTQNLKCFIAVNFDGTCYAIHTKLRNRGTRSTGVFTKEACCRGQRLAYWPVSFLSEGNFLGGLLTYFGGGCDHCWGPFIFLELEQFVICSLLRISSEAGADTGAHCGQEMPDPISLCQPVCSCFMNNTHRHTRPWTHSGAVFLYCRLQGHSSQSEAPSTGSAYNECIMQLGSQRYSLLGGPGFRSQPGDLLS